MANHAFPMQCDQRSMESLGHIRNSNSLYTLNATQPPPVSLVKYVPQVQTNELSDSLISGSYNSSKSRTHVGSYGNTYENIMKNNKSTESAHTYSLSNRSLENNNLALVGKKGTTGSIGSYPNSTLHNKSVMGTRSLYAPSYYRMSRSLKASQASLVTYKSGRSTIQAEHHDRKVRRKINSAKFGRARKLYWIAVAFFTLFLVVLFIGLLITCLRHVYMNIILSLDIGELTGPLLISCSVLFFGIGLKFYYDAYRVGSEERMRIKYKAASPSTVAITTVSQRVDDQLEKLISGKTSQNAVSRAPIGSRVTLCQPA